MTENQSVRTDADDNPSLSAIREFLTVYRYLRQYSQQIHDSGHSGRRLSTLRYLVDHGPATMGTLASYLFVSESSTSELISKLEDAGLVVRQRSKVDNRVVVVTITDAGNAVAEETALGGIPLLRERIRELPEAEARTIGLTFRRLRQLLNIPEVSQ